MPRHALVLCLSSLLAIFAATSSAAADDVGRDNLIPGTRLYGGLWLGFGGDADWDAPGSNVGDLETTVGGQVGLEQVLGRYFSIGPEVRFGSVKWKSADRSKLIDINLKPRIRFPLRNTPLELYLTVPVGLTIPRLAELDNDDGADGKVGWNWGVGAGLHVLLTDHFGLNVEPIWMQHHFKVDGELGNDDAFKVKQFSLLLNAVLAF